MNVYPHSMSYFNELAGGPRNGHSLMLHSSSSWTHENFFLKRWLQMHPEVESPFTCLGRSVPLEYLGIRDRGEPPRCTRRDLDGVQADPYRVGPVPGWHVINLQQIRERDGRYLYFEKFTPVAEIGYSVNVYHITLDEANEVRRGIGAPELPMELLSPEQLLAAMQVASRSPRSIQIALYAEIDSNGATQAEIDDILDREPYISTTLVTATDICAGRLRGYDAILVPGGRGSEQGDALGSQGRKAIRDFVREGGGYVGVCAGAYLATAKYPWSLGLVNAQTMTGTRYVPGQGPQQASFRGATNVLVEFNSVGRVVLGGPKSAIAMWYSSGPIFFPTNEVRLPDYIPLGYYLSEACKYPFQKDTMVHSPAIIAASYGRGRVVLFSPHPENNKETQQFICRAVLSVAKTPLKAD